MTGLFVRFLAVCLNYLPAACQLLHSLHSLSELLDNCLFGFVLVYLLVYQCISYGVECPNPTQIPLDLGLYLPASTLSVSLSLHKTQTFLTGQIPCLRPEQRRLTGRHAPPCTQVPGIFRMGRNRRNVGT